MARKHIVICLKKIRYARISCCHRGKPLFKDPFLSKKLELHFKMSANPTTALSAPSHSFLPGFSTTSNIAHSQRNKTVGSQSMQECPIVI